MAKNNKQKPKFTLRATSIDDFKNKFEKLKHVFINGRNNDEDEDNEYA